jgi:hypothetical protein
MGMTLFGGAWYLLSFTDDFSRKTSGYFLKSKDEVKEKFEEFHTLAESQRGKSLKMLRTHNGSGRVSRTD